MLPTPKAQDGIHPGVQTCKPGQTLHLSAAVMLPTATSRDWKHGSSAQVNKFRSEGLNDRAAHLNGNGTKLNPKFVERLMGFPVDWTDLRTQKTDRPCLLSPVEVMAEIQNATDSIKIPNRKERLQALGNAVVPQCAAITLHKAKEIFASLG
jgi:site-specific DNA-cytosine methylase